MLLRLVLLLILLLLLARFAFLLARRARAVLRGGAAPPPLPRAVPLVACHACGVMVPQPRAMTGRDGATLCRSCAVR